MPSGGHPPAGSGRGRPSSRGLARLRRARVVAIGAVVLCLAADAWAVSVALGRDAAAEPSRPSGQSGQSASSPSGATGGAATVATGDVSAMTSLSYRAGGSFVPAVDTSETVPVEASDVGTSGAGTSGAGTSGAGTAGAGAAKVVARGDGRFTPVAIPAGALRTATTGRTVRISLDVEGGLGVDTAEFARTVATVLTDARGWQAKDKVRFVAVSPAQVAKRAPVDLRISLTSPDTTDRLCAPLQTRGQVSCHNLHRVVLNARRWQLGAVAYGKDVQAYRTYLVNHEVGHGLGHGHALCPGAGRPAPVMMQQTYGLRGCTAWPWPATKSS